MPVAIACFQLLYITVELLNYPDLHFTTLGRILFIHHKGNSQSLITDTSMYNYYNDIIEPHITLHAHSRDIRKGQVR